jgi:autotransporter-associated beta strand protein
MNDRFYTAKRVRNRHLLAGVSCAALALVCGIPSEVMAGTYTASDPGQLNGAIAAANADADPNATIQLTGSFSVTTTSLTAPAKPITIDTQGFTLSGQAGAGASSGGGVNLVGGAGGMFTLVGNFKGGNADLGGGGQGLQIRLGASVTNNGFVEGGSSLRGSGGPGVILGGPGAPGTLINKGTIRGGTGALGGGQGLQVRTGANPVVNSGTIEGGAGAHAIQANTATVSLNLINSGTIRAGAGQANAIGLAPGATTGIINLELQAGSVIEGNVVANAAATTDTLRLGGTDDAIFDVSAIGPQYQNFDIYQKTGTSDWYLTGTGTATTNWDIQSGFLTIGNGGTSGSVIGDITLNGGTLGFFRSDTVTFDNVITGTGEVMQYGSGKTILNGNYTYSGLTSVVAGTLAINGSIATPVSVASAGTLGGLVRSSAM